MLCTSSRGWWWFSIICRVWCGLIPWALGLGLLLDLSSSWMVEEKGWMHLNHPHHVVWSGIWVDFPQSRALPWSFPNLQNLYGCSAGSREGCWLLSSSAFCDACLVSPWVLFLLDLCESHWSPIMVCSCLLTATLQFKQGFTSLPKTSDGNFGPFQPLMKKGWNEHRGRKG